jgi:hypothetical protein
VTPLRSLLAIAIVVLLFGVALSLAQKSAAKAIDPETIGKAYGENAVNADLLYKGKVLSVECRSALQR